MAGLFSVVSAAVEDCKYCRSVLLQDVYVVLDTSLDTLYTNLRSHTYFNQSFKTRINLGVGNGTEQCSRGCYGDAFELCYSENLHGNLSQGEISDITKQFERDSRATLSSLPSTELDGLALPPFTGDDDVDLCVVQHYQEKIVTARCSLAIHELKLVTAYVERSTGVGVIRK
jgi:hypothetical protein